MITSSRNLRRSRKQIQCLNSIWQTPLLQALGIVDLALTVKIPTVFSMVEVIKEVLEIEEAVVGMAAVVEVMTSEVVTGDEEVTMAMVVISEVATGTAILG